MTKIGLKTELKEPEDAQGAHPDIGQKWPAGGAIPIALLVPASVRVGYWTGLKASVQLGLAGEEPIRPFEHWGLLFTAAVDSNTLQPYSSYIQGQIWLNTIQVEVWPREAVI